MLECRNLSKTFLMHIRGGRKICGFSNVNFTLNQGDFLGISGPSGIGKSSLLKCIYRTYLPLSGSLAYTAANNEEIDLVKADDHTVIGLRKNEIGYVSQFLHILPRVPAFETIMKSLTSRGFEEKESRLRTEQMLIKLGIDDALWSLFPSTFSGGEKQRLNIIHATIWKPRLLLVDEPTSSLDPLSKERVLELINTLKKEGTTMIGVFHDQKLLEEIETTHLSLSSKSLDEVYA